MAKIQARAPCLSTAIMDALQEETTSINPQLLRDDTTQAQQKGVLAPRSSSLIAVNPAGNSLK